MLIKRYGTHPRITKIESTPSSGETLLGTVFHYSYWGQVTTELTQVPITTTAGTLTHFQSLPQGTQLLFCHLPTVNNQHSLNDFSWTMTRPAVGQIPPLFLHRNGVFFALLNADIYMSGEKGTSIQATLSTTPEISELTGDGWGLTTITGKVVYLIGDMTATRTRSANRTVVNIKSAKLEAVRRPTTVNIPGQSATSRPGATLTAGGWDVIPGDVFLTPTMSGIARHVQVSLSADDSRTWIYG